ncbi:FAD-dependent monooxygenase [Paenibacillus sp. GCM10027629]|uniref:FAD-dependent monooxygenase n=1 Tax=Paenibacillus sp. GCM10027629 TaxID=3273414 RepID=UPI00362AD713
MNSHQHIQRPVLVVGAGPVGMTAALALRSCGVQATIVEADPQERIRAGSRAIYIHNATLKLLEQIKPGLGFTLARHGLTWPVKRTMYQGKEVYMKKYPSAPPNELPAFTSLAQVEIEKHLYQACLDAGVEFVWHTPIKHVKTDPNGVTLTSESGKEWTAPYIIGADGSRSVVRQELGMKLVGPRSSDSFLVVDVKEDPDHPLPLVRTFHYKHPEMGGRNVLYVPFTGGWRIDLQLLEGDNPEDFGGVDGVRKWLPKVMDPKYADRITWVSTYQFYQVVADSYTDVHRRALLVGEAAHLFAPFGARGLNSGVPDALLSAQAIAKALEASDPNEAEQAILAAANERQFAAEYNRDCAGIALEHIQGSSPSMNTKRELAASLSSMVPSLGRWLDEGPYGPRTNHVKMSTKY